MGVEEALHERAQWGWPRALRMGGRASGVCGGGGGALEAVGLLTPRRVRVRGLSREGCGMLGIRLLVHSKCRDEAGAGWVGLTHASERCKSNQIQQLRPNVKPKMARTPN